MGVENQRKAGRKCGDVEGTLALVIGAEEQHSTATLDAPDPSAL